MATGSFCLKAQMEEFIICATPPELDEARSRGDLTTNSFVVIDKTKRTRTADAESLSRISATPNRCLKTEIISGLWQKRLLLRGVVPFDDERWGGWLGKYYETLREAVFELDAPKVRSRKRGVDLER